MLLFISARLCIIRMSSGNCNAKAVLARFKFREAIEKAHATLRYLPKYCKRFSAPTLSGAS